MSANNEIIQELVDKGIAKVVDGLTISRATIINLVNKDVLSDDEVADLMFEVNIFLSCVKTKGEQNAN